MESQGGPVRQQSNSEEMKTNSEVLVTNLTLSSNWIADNMVGFQKGDDEQIEECQVCLIPFSFLVRKHHCRSCGRVVCGMCSKYKMIFNNKETPYRVCCSCYFEYQRDGNSFTCLLCSAKLTETSFFLHIQRGLPIITCDRTGFLW